MTDSTPDWLAVMRQIDGTKWAPGDGPSDTIQSWLSFIGTTNPNMASYCNSVARLDYFSWCGLTVAYCMAKAGIPPVFGATETTRFLFAMSWLGFGTPVTSAPQAGDVLIFDFGGGDHHVTLFEKDNGNGTYACRGGNQSHVANVTNFPKSRLMGIRRPSAAGATPMAVASSGTLVPGAEGRLVTALQGALAAAGFDPGGVDGEYGPLTSAAVSAFQRARNLPITGIADPATLQNLGVSIDTSSQPLPATEASTTMQPQDLLKTIIDALIVQRTGQAPTQATAPGQVDMTQILQLAISALSGKPLQLPVAPTAGTATTPSATVPVLSTIDNIFGGEALAGKKTLIAVIAYVILAILQATGVAGTAMGDTATPTGQILTTLIGAFGTLGGAAKIDRLTQLLGLIAGQAAQK
ncbi:C40 family peptidase [Bradyrhizobium sp. CCBAU 51627]|uniref:C40 family peptidase n=1 Tax=Bradyrhizobium sp. CCBAU 51627 TaxID=1325088 RepID=UPI002304E67C|nr:peptidoglycan-binding protein [Bradyrhizobium sp. CCBAU 51627]